MEWYWNRFELALEAKIPDSITMAYSRENSLPFEIIRYEVAIGITKENDQISILDERVLLKRFKKTNQYSGLFFLKHRNWQIR